MAQFAKGISGNKGGRPKLPKAFRRHARRLVDQGVLDGWYEEYKARGDHWLRCSELLVAYAYGKPFQAMPEPEDDMEDVNQLLAGMSDADVDALAAQPDEDEPH